MTLHVYTARLSHAIRDPDRLDITRAGKDPLGAAFAPTDALLWPAKRELEEAAAIRARAADLFAASQVPGGAPALLAEADRIEAETWARYQPAYLAEMRISYGVPPRGSPTSPSFEAWQRGARPRPDAWRTLLARPRVVLACFCHARERCHRGHLAAILVRLGAVDGGEIGAPPETAREDRIARGPCAVNALEDGRAD